MGMMAGGSRHSRDFLCFNPKSLATREPLVGCPVPVVGDGLKAAGSPLSRSSAFSNHLGNGYLEGNFGALRSGLFRRQHNFLTLNVWRST